MFHFLGIVDGITSVGRRSVMSFDGYVVLFWGGVGFLAPDVANF